VFSFLACDFISSDGTLSEIVFAFVFRVEREPYKQVTGRIGQDWKMN
jgi:hypothetical protein